MKYSTLTLIESKLYVLKTPHIFFVYDKITRFKCTLHSVNSGIKSFILRENVFLIKKKENKKK